MPQDPPLLYGVILAGYLFALLLVGAWKASSVRNQEDFQLAGRSLGSTVLAGTLIATWIGTGSIFGNAEEAYLVGLSTWIIPLAGAVGIFVLWRLASNLRSKPHVTIQDLLEERFGPGARIMGTLALLTGYVVIVSYQYRAGAAVLQYASPGLSQEAAICLVATIVILYTALAGMASVAKTDLINGALMTIGVLAVLALQLIHIGGPTELVSSLPVGHEKTTGAYPPVRALSILLPSFLLVLGDANLYQRFFSAKNPRTAKRSALWMLVGVLLLEYAILTLAICGRARVETGAIEAPDNPAHIIIHMAFTDPLLPPWLGAVLLATVVAVIVSTADSYLLSPATSLVRDVWQRFGPKRHREQAPLILGRFAVLGLGLIALGLAFTTDEFFSVALFAYTIYGATITPALLAALFWPGATPGGALAGMITGLGTAISWRFYLKEKALMLTHPDGWIHELLGSTDAVIPALLAATTALVLVSNLAPKPPSDGFSPSRPSFKA